MFESQGQEWQQSLYDQLYQLCEAALSREKPGHSLQPTLLVNDVYLKLCEQRNIDFENRSQVMAAGAITLRRVLVDYARHRNALRRGGPDGRGIPLHISVADSAKPIELLELDEALNQLMQESPRAAQVVELKFFGGLSGAEIAEQLEVSVRTVNNDWVFAKARLYQIMATDENKQSNHE